MRKNNFFYLFVIGILLLSCRGSRTITNSNATLTEKDEIMIAANGSYPSTSIVGYGGKLAEQNVIKNRENKFLHVINRIDTLAGVQVKSLTDSINTHFVALLENDILFDHDKHSINDKALITLANLSKILCDLPDAKITIVGHTDNTGEEKYNYELSLKRAKKVAQVLHYHGIGNIEERGAGEKEPITSNDTEEGRSQNRRVEIKISK